jgi:subtilase family serine protease
VVNIPRVRPGAYYLLAKTDADAAVFETNEDNNLRAQPIQLNAPDLAVIDLAIGARTVTSASKQSRSRGNEALTSQIANQKSKIENSMSLLTSSPTGPSASLRQTIEIAWTVKNTGAGDTTGTWADALYLSPDTTLDATDDLLTTVNRSGPLPAGSFYGVTATAQIPAVPAGQYYLIVRADKDAATSDANRANNERAVPITVRAPDLTPINLSAPPIASINQPLEVAWSVENQGSGDALPSWTDALYLSTDNFWDGNDLKLTTVTRAVQLAARDSYTVATTVNVPTTQPGEYFLIVRADDSASLIEALEGNNERIRAIQIAVPDLVVTDLRTGLGVSAAPPAKPPRITSIRRNQDDTVELAWTGADNAVQVEFTPTLSPPNWQSIGAPVTGTNVVLPHSLVGLAVIEPGSSGRQSALTSQIENQKSKIPRICPQITQITQINILHLCNLCNLWIQR